jgi:hypothetical protein
MTTQTINRVEYSELFKFAEVYYNLSWNESNDLFFNYVVSYESFAEYTIDEVANHTWKSERAIFAFKILLDFMQQNNINSIFIIG